MKGEHRKRYRLGYGVAVEFVFRSDDYRRDEVNTRALSCEWDPALPKLRPGNARNKFLRRYIAARDDFYQDVAQLMGGNVLNIGLDERGQIGEMTAYQPQPRH